MSTCDRFGLILCARRTIPVAIELHSATILINKYAGDIDLKSLPNMGCHAPRGLHGIA
jgi:hypothetical protein